MATTHPVRLIDHPPHPAPNVGLFLKNMAIAWGQAIGRWLVCTHEPTIVKGRDRHGNPYWEVYDPRTQRTMYYVSEAEVRQWLDEAY